MQESQTKITNAVQAFFDAQLALQKDVFAATTAGFQGVLALERASLKAAARAAETGAEFAKKTTETLPVTVKAWAQNIPMVDAETAERLSKETGATLVQLRETAEKSAVAARQAAEIAAKNYEAFLAELETRGLETLKVAETNVAQTTVVVRDAAKSAVETAYATAERAVSTVKPQNVPQH